MGAAVEQETLARRMERPEGSRGTASVVDLIARACVDHHEVVAATGVGGTLTYEELWRRATGLARELRRRGVAQEDRVGLWASQSSELLVGIAGILIAGAAYVPLDPAFPRSRLELIAADSGIELVVAPARARTSASRLGVEIVDSSVRATPDDARALPRVDGGDAAYVIYTSGSLGRPKGVVVEHHSLVDLFSWMHEEVPVRPGDRFIGTASPAFDASIPYLLYPLVSGATYVAIDPDVASDPYLLSMEIESARPRVLLTLPAMLRMLTETRWRGDERLEVWTGGERTAPEVIRYVVPRVRSLRNWYGPTEATVQVSVARLHRDDAESPVGFSPRHVSIVLRDAEGNEPAHGATGELYIVGSALARGYLNDPALTAERFGTLELDGHEVRAYRTGDLGRRRADGSLVILGRVDEQLNLRGFRVEPGDIEARLQAHPDVIDAVVVPRRADDGETNLVAFVTTRGSLDVGSLRAFARDELPAHMVPAVVRVVASLPLSSSGKVDRAALAASAEMDVVVTAAPPARAAEGATELERSVLELFASVLALDVATIGLDQDFFDLGGTSLKSVRLFLAIEEHLGTQLPLSTLATAATPRALAAVIDAAKVHGDGIARRADPPQHEWERILAGLWCERLGLGHVSRSESFFSLGGTEDDAAAMLHELATEYGVEVSIAELRRRPTVADLAGLVGDRSEHAVLVPLTSTGTGPPLFLIAGAGGLAITFLPLARLLGPDQPCYGLQAQGIEHRAVPDLTLAQGARRYVRAIREVQPRGPYLLGGHSLGGVLALKVAQQLDREGEEVALLAIFDTPLSSSMVGRRAFRASRRGPTTSGTLPKGLPRLKTVLHLPTVGVVPRRGTEQFEAFAALGELQAVVARRLGTWAGPATLFLSDEDEACVIEARWGTILTGAWTSAHVPGGHIAMLEPSNIGVAAAILSDQIARALGTSAASAAPHPAPEGHVVGHVTRR